MKNIPDEKIVAQVQKGDKDAYAEIVDRYEKPLRAYAMRITANPDAIEDIVQEAFIKAYRDIQSFDTKRKFSSWIYRIVHNESINHIRKNKNLVPLDETVEIADEKNLSKEIEQKIDSKKDFERLNLALESLENKYREVVYLRFFQEKDYEEIAEILRMPIGTVGTLLNRGKAKLKLEYQKRANEVNR